MRLVNLNVSHLFEFSWLLCFFILLTLVFLLFYTSQIKWSWRLASKETSFYRKPASCSCLKKQILVILLSERGWNKLRGKIRKTEKLKTCWLFEDKRYLFFFNVALKSVPLHRVWHCFVRQNDILFTAHGWIPLICFLVYSCQFNRIADCFYNRERLYWNIVMRDPWIWQLCRKCPLWHLLVGSVSLFVYLIN